MKDFTIVPNEILRESQLRISERYLLCVLLRYCGNDEYCFPSQETLGKELGCSGRHIRTLLKNLEKAGLIYKKRRGWNRSNTYKVAKAYSVDGDSGSVHLGSKIPLHWGSTVPPNSIYRKAKDNTRQRRGMKKLRADFIEGGILGG